MPIAYAVRTLLFTASLLAVLTASSCTSAPPPSSSSDTRPTPGSGSIAPGQGLYNTDDIHTVDVSFDDAEYRAMLDTYAKTQDKDWIKAKVTVDGSTFEGAGMRLKGNSSLFSLRSSDGQTGGPGQGGGPAIGPGGNANPDEPESLPWLVKLDKYEDDANFGGVREFVVRSNSSKTALNEALALDLLREVGLASQRSTHVALSVNGGQPALRLVIENPNDEWDADHFDAEGILYKSEASGNWTYRGDDPSSYKDVFDQETRTDDENLAPLIDFLKFVNDSDDATFAAELRNRLDVEAFAKYLAYEDLIGNFDDIDGPGNNSYLRYDEGTKRFTVVAWDHNLAFGGMQRMFRGGSGAPLPGGSVPQPGGSPAGGFPPGGFPGGGPPGGTIPTGGFPGGAPPGGIPAFGQNPLVNRFHANAELKKLYDDEVAALRASLFTSGRAADVLARRSQLLLDRGASLVDAAVIDSEVAEINAVITS